MLERPRSHFLLILIFLCTGAPWGCSKVIVGLTGMHIFDRDVSRQKVSRMARRMGLRDTDYFVLSGRYAKWMEVRKEVDTERQWQSRMQPLQLRYYGEDRRVEWLIPNCDVGGFPNLNWASFGLPDSLVPRKQQRITDSTWTIDQDLDFMVRPTSVMGLANVPKAKGHLLVYWTYFAGRQSKRLVRHVRKWKKLHDDQTTVIYVNADSLHSTSDTITVEP